MIPISSRQSAKRWIEGWACVATPDTDGNVIVPQGASVSLPIPLRQEHGPYVLGSVIRADITKHGIYIGAEIRNDGNELADALWEHIRRRPAMGLSVGFGKGHVSEPLPAGGERFIHWPWLELSIVRNPLHDQARVRCVMEVFNWPHPLDIKMLDSMGKTVRQDNKRSKTCRR